jgi:hypothetical protein
LARVAKTDVTESRADQHPGRPEDIKAVPVRHSWRWVAGVIILIVAAALNS